mgnify:CR=1 FL=1
MLSLCICRASLLLLLVGRAAAFSSYQRALPNGNSNGGKMGHGGAARSGFGADVGRAGRSWTTAFCEMVRRQSL